MEVLNTIKDRYSPRAFSKQPVEKDKLMRLFEAARWAPSSYNGQPWRFIYATRDNADLWDKLFDALDEFNQVWVKNAPVLVLTAARKSYEHDGNPYEHSWHDVGLAIGNLMNQATHEGLYIHQMGGFDFDKAANNINLPNEYEPVNMFVIGYKGNLSDLPENFREMESKRRVRKELDEIVFDKSF